MDAFESQPQILNSGIILKNILTLYIVHLELRLTPRLVQYFEPDNPQKVSLKILKNTNGVFFFVFSGAEIQLYSQWNSGDFFPNFEKKSQSSKKNVFEDWDFHSVNTHIHKSYMVHGDILLQFNGNSICYS